MPGAERGLSSPALPPLGRQQIHDSLERLLFSQIIACFISASSLHTPFFPLHPCILPGKPLSMSTPSTSVKEYQFYWAELTVPEESQSLDHPCWQLSLLTSSWAARDIPKYSAQIPQQSWIFSLQHLWQTNIFPKNISWKHVLLSAFFIAYSSCMALNSFAWQGFGSGGPSNGASEALLW